MTLIDYDLLPFFFKCWGTKKEQKQRNDYSSRMNRCDMLSFLR